MNAVLENPGKVWTYEGYLGLNDEISFEIINGKALKSPSPELFHQRWARKIFVAVQRHVEAHQLGEVFFALVDVVLDETNVVQPDIIYRCETDTYMDALGSLYVLFWHGF